MSRSGGEATRDRVQAELTAPLAALGYDLEAVELTPAGRRRVLRVAVDKDGGVTLDEVAEATREVSRVLDAGDAMGEQPYTLEVTSRGVDRPLTQPRHWRRNSGRLVAVTLCDGDTVTGRILRADEAGAVITTHGDAPAERSVAYPAVARAQVQVEFNRSDPRTPEPGGGR